MTQQQFEPGDSITIDEVVSSKRGLSGDEEIIVRGHYRLRSRTAARLSFSVTTLGRGIVTPILPEQNMEVTAGSGTFELVHDLWNDGAPHVSFYAGPYGSSFSGVYFALKP